MNVVNMLAVTHLVCAAAFTFLAVVIALGRPSNRAAKQALLACVLTAAWAGMVGFSGFGFAGAIPLLETLRSLAWVVVAGSLLLPSAEGIGALPRGRTWLLLVPILAVFIVVTDVNHFAAAPDRIYFTLYQVLGRIALAVLGIVVLENLYRNSSDDSRWKVAPICVGLGGIFVFDLIVYSDAILLRHLDQTLLVTRAVVDTLAVPLIALAMARNRSWHIDVHVSRDFVFHTATFLASGAFLLSVGLVATVFRSYGGAWGVVVQLSLAFGGVLVLAMALASRQMRSRLKRLINENLFSHRYDYRAEWIKFIDALSSSTGADLQQRVIRSVADIVDSPGGVLWLLSDNVYRPAASWNVTLPESVREPAGTPFMASFQNGRVIQRLNDVRTTPGAPPWLQLAPPFWLAVPLPHQARLIGFLLLAQPPGTFHLDWEALQLLGTVGRQAASYLSEEDAARALSDAKALSDYSKRFAFVVHDIKNLASQLSLVLSNADKFSGDPEFQKDALHTIRGSVERMNRLLQQLRVVRAPAGANPGADVDQAAREVLATSGHRSRILMVPSGGNSWASIEAGALRSVLAHLFDNAVEASGVRGTVTVRVEEEPDCVVVEVSDQGKGMDASFVRNELFRPFRSTKASGYGIGAYQARELVRAAGGELEVKSIPGAGTTMRVVLPIMKRSAPSAVPAA